MGKSLKTIYIVLGVGVISYALYRFYKKQFKVLTQDYDYKVIGAKIKSIKATEFSFDLKIRFFNKSKIEATINRLYMDVFFEDAKVGYLSESKPLLIPANGSSDIDLSLSFNPQLILKNIVGILFSGVKQKDLNFTLKGYANIRSGFISTTLPIEFKDKVSAYI